MRLQVTGIIETTANVNEPIREGTMEFSANLTTAEKQSSCQSAIDIIEPGLYTAALAAGLDPAAVAVDYDVPVGATVETHPLEFQLKDWVDKLAVVKAHLATL